MTTSHPSENEMNFDDDSYLLKESNGNYVYIAKAPAIKNLVFSGGGAKGAVYPGVQEALEEKGPNGISVRDQVEAVAGSSVGAMQAAFFAAGGSAEDLKKKTENLNFKSLLGSSSTGINKDGIPLFNFVNELIHSSITQLLKDKNYNFYARYELLTDKDRSNIDKLLAEAKQPGGIKSSITFAMLRSLHELDPVNFKDLSITATRQDTGESYVFNADTTPDLDIALACRASASLPVFLAPVAIETKYLPGGPFKEAFLIFVDGGYLDNIPVSAVDGKQKKERGVNEGMQGQNLHTMAFVFDETKGKKNQSPYYEANPFGEREFYEPSRLEKFIRNTVPRKIGGIRGETKNTDAKARGLKEINMNYTQRHLPLSVGGVSSSDFKKAQKRSKRISDSGREAMRGYLAAHREEAIYLSEKNPVALMLTLPSEKLQVIVDANRSVYGLSPQDLKMINAFRLEAANLIRDQSTNAILFRYLANLAQVPENKQAYADFIIYELRRDTKTWEAALNYAKTSQQDETLPLAQKDILQAILKQDAKDQLFAKQKELLQWIKKTKHISRYPANLALLDNATEAVRRAENYNDLAMAVAKIQTGYATGLANFSLKNLLRRAKPSKEAEAHVLLIKEEGRKWDQFLSPSAEAPVKQSSPTPPQKALQDRPEAPRAEENKGPTMGRF